MVGKQENLICTISANPVVSIASFMVKRGTTSLNFDVNLSQSSGTSNEGDSTGSYVIDYKVNNCIFFFKDI